jgi:hypothetical protein
VSTTVDADLSQLVWSGDSRWLGFTGVKVRQWDTRGGLGATYGSAVFGRIDLGDGTVRAGSTRQEDLSSLVIGGSGRVWVIGAVHFRQLGDWASPLTRVPPEDHPPTMASPDGRLALLGDTKETVPPDVTVAFLDRDESTMVALPAESRGDGTRAHTVGWLDDTHAVVDLTVLRAEPEGTADARRDLVIVDASAPDQEPRRVTEIDANLAEQGARLSVATDLMTTAQPTVARPVPPRPWSTTDKVLLGLGVALVAGLGLAFVVRRRRLP